MKRLGKAWRLARRCYWAGYSAGLQAAAEFVAQYQTQERSRMAEALLNLAKGVRAKGRR